MLDGEAANAADGLGEQQQEQAGGSVDDLELSSWARRWTKAQRWSLLMMRAVK
ncbi:hypothetical protein ABZ707_30130 [Streptomyces sp. NPDC006923]|uniref:hypothetical protein n=1 Tax=Streptomyces sp. NPDC006923 TaxID=3155355 RepID=UPI0033BFC0B9